MGFFNDEFLNNSRLNDVMQQVTDIDLEKADKTEVNSLATEKANISYVDAEIASVASGTPESFTNLTAIQAAYPTGSTYVKLNLADGYVYKWNGTAWVQGWVYQSTNFANGSIVREKVATNGITRNMTKFYQSATSNLFNKNEVTIGYPDYATGVYNNNSTYRTSDYIPCTDGENYIASVGSFVTFYTANKTFVSGINAPSCTVPTGQSIAYLRYTLQTSNLDTFIIAQGTTLPVYENYKVYDNQLLISSTNLDKTVISNIPLDAVQGFVRNPQNLFDKSTVTLGYYYSFSNNSYISHASFCTSELIPISGETTYVHQNGTFQTFYDSNNKFISGSNVNPVTSPANAVYMRLGMSVSNYQTEMLLKGTVFPTLYVPFSYLADTKFNTSVSVCRWNGKKWGALGDSITAAKKYQPLVVAKTNLICTSYGVGGSTIAINANSSAGAGNSFVERVNTLTTADLVSIFGGVNDFDRNTPMGDISSTDTSTFYGALKYLIEYLNTNMQDVQPVFFTPLPWYVKTTNSLGLKLKDYRNAIIEVAETYGIPYLDLFTKSGLNSLNIARYTSDLLHPNDLGTQYYYPRIVGFLNDI